MSHYVKYFDNHYSQYECIYVILVKHISADLFLLFSANGVMVMFLLIAFLFWTIRVAKVFLYFFKLLEIKSFYRDALHITEVGEFNLIAFKTNNII